MAEERSLSAELATMFERLGSYGRRSVAESWKEIFQAEVGSSEFYVGLSLVTEKLDRVEADIKASKLKERNKALALEAVSTLRGYTAFPQVLNEHSAHVMAKAESYHRLHMLDEILPTLDARDVDKATIDILIEDLKELLETLDEAVIDDRLRAFLRAQISQLLWALLSFDVVGIDGITRIWGATVAEIMRSQGMRGGHEPQAQAWYASVWKFAQKVGKLVIFAGAVAGGAENLITSGDHIVAVLAGQTQSPATTADNLQAPDSLPKSGKNGEQPSWDANDPNQIA